MTSECSIKNSHDSSQFLIKSSGDLKIFSCWRFFVRCVQYRRDQLFYSMSSGFLIGADCSVVLLLLLLPAAWSEKCFACLSFSFCQRSERASWRIAIFYEKAFLSRQKTNGMSSNSTSAVVGDCESSGVSSTTSSNSTACDDRTCSTAKCALCLHCSQQYCFVHFLQHNEQLSLNAYNFTLAIDQLGRRKMNHQWLALLFFDRCLEDQIKNLKLDETLRRMIHSLDQWRKNLVRTIENVYQEKLSSIKANYILLSNFLQQFQFEQSSHVQALRIDLEQMKFVRSTYGRVTFESLKRDTPPFRSDQEMEKIQSTIQQLQKNCADLQYDLRMKERLAPNIYDSIECELIWKRARSEATSDEDSSNTGDNQTDEGVPEDSTTSSTPPSALSSSSSPTTYEHSLISFLVNNGGLTAQKPSSHSNTTTLNGSNKKRRMCTSCGKC